MSATKTKSPWKTLTAVGDCVIVQEAAPEDRTVGGILLPTQAQEQPPEGTVLSLGEECEDEAEFRVGERVVFLPHAGAKVAMQGGEVVKVMRLKDVIAVRR